MVLIAAIRASFKKNGVLYSAHARREMHAEEFGLIKDREVNEAVQNGTIIENYPEDTPYPSVLIFGTTGRKRPLHIVAAYDHVEKKAVIVTVYQPDPARWEGFTRRKQ